MEDFFNVQKYFIIFVSPFFLHSDFLLFSIRVINMDCHLEQKTLSNIVSWLCRLRFTSQDICLQCLTEWIKPCLKDETLETRCVLLHLEFYLANTTKQLQLCLWWCLSCQSELSEFTFSTQNLPKTKSAWFTNSWTCTLPRILQGLSASTWFSRSSCE